MYKNKNEFNNVFRTFETVITMKKGRFSIFNNYFIEIHKNSIFLHIYTI